MKHLLKSLILLFLIGVFHCSINAQQVNTLYFMENVPIRHYLNPAFQPTTKYYLSLPIIGFTQFNIGNNSLSLKDIVYNNNGQIITFLHPNGDINRFYNTLHSNTVIRTDLETNLLSFGIKEDQSFWSFSLSEKINGMGSIPKDFFKFFLFGTPNIENNAFNINTLQADITAYTEAAFGFSKKLDEKLSVGIKLKFLYGNANVSNTNKEISLNAGIEKWILMAEGSTNASMPTQFQVDKNYQTVSITSPKNVTDWLKPSGLGAGVDLGVEYRLNKDMKISGAITDLGFLHWFTNVQNFNYITNFTFDGLTQVKNGNTNYQNLYTKLISGNYLADSLKSAIQSASSIKRSNNNYNTGTTAKLNLGFEYNLLEDLSLGLLSHSQFSKKTITEELTASVNLRPTKWFNASLSYSVLDGRMSSIGAGIGLKTGIIHWFLAADYIPFQISTFSPSNFGANYPTFKIPVPYNSKDFNFAIGMNLVFNSLRAKDRNDSSSSQSDGLNTSPNANFNSKSKNKISSSSYNKQNGLYHKKSNNDCNCDLN